MTKEIAATAVKLNTLLVKPQTQVCMGYMRSNRYGKESRNILFFRTQVLNKKNSKHFIQVFIKKLKVLLTY